MAITNYFETLTALAELVSDFVPVDNIYLPENHDSITNNLVLSQDIAGDRIALTIMYRGYTVSILNSKKGSPRSKFRLLYEIGILCPIDEFTTTGGELMVQLINAVSGYKYSESYTPFELHNLQETRPALNIDLSYIPLLLSTEVVI